MMHAERDKALAALDRALDDRPEKTYGDIAEAVRCVVALRDRLIAEQRGGADIRAELGRVNAVLSHIVGGEYPLEGVRRDRIKKAREELAATL
jgi:hypothetical protein